MPTAPQETGAAPVRTGLLIDGKPVETEAWTAVRNPAAPDLVVGHAAAATPEQARAAVAAADAAFPAWAAMPARRRAEIISEALTLLDGSEDVVTLRQEGAQSQRWRLAAVSPALPLADDHASKSVVVVTVRRPLGRSARTGRPWPRRAPGRRRAGAPSP
ncbi:aldehyde dehydrogenase family protein [Streptomyces canus]|uniref:aldehyde dehydrogenase family protein n=1 Tax=Streptomyces canus TaxID=58343 RepID=UPI00371ABFA5